MDNRVAYGEDTYLEHHDKTTRAFDSEETSFPHRFDRDLSGRT